MAQIQVFIPAYNTAQYIDQCLESLVNQTFTDWEAVIVNDASTDGRTPQLCDEWAARDKRIRVIHLEKNIGLSQVRNRFIQEMNAPYIAFLDSDDAIAPNHLQSMLGAMQESDSDLVLCGVQRISESGNFVRNSGAVSEQKVWPQPLATLAIAMDVKYKSYVWKHLYKRELLASATFPNRRYFEDYHTIVSIVAKANKVVHTGCNSYLYRRTQSGITRSKSEVYYLDFMAAAQHRIEVIHSLSMLSQEQKELASLTAKGNAYKSWYRLARLLKGNKEHPLYREGLQIVSSLGIKSSGLSVLIKGVQCKRKGQRAWRKLAQAHKELL